MCRTTIGEDRLYTRGSDSAAQWLEVADDPDRRGTGWGNAEVLPSGRAQQLAGASASLLVPLAAPADLEWHARLRGSAPNQRVDLEVNGVRLGAQPLSADWTTVQWSLPHKSLREGTNEIRFHVGGPARPDQRAAVQYVRIVRLLDPD